MAGPKRLVLFVEGEGDERAVPVLVKQLLTDLQAWDCVILDPHPLKVGNVAEVTHGDGKEWARLLNIARKRRNLGGVLLLQDGDLKRIRKEEFCPPRFAYRLAEWAKGAGGGSVFSVGVVFACCEYESWLLACARQLAGQLLPDGRPGIPADAVPPDSDLEIAPRDAKKWLDQRIEAGYKEGRDQGALTHLMVGHLDAVRQRNMKSFRRLEHALEQLVTAIRTDTHIVTPEPSPAASA